MNTPRRDRPARQAKGEGSDDLNHATMVRLLLRAQLQVLERVAPQVGQGTLLGQLQSQLGVLLATWLPHLRDELEGQPPNEVALLALRRLGVVTDAQLVSKGDRMEIHVDGCIFLEPSLEMLPQCHLCVPSLALESVLTSEDGSLNVGNVLARSSSGCDLLLTSFRDEAVVNHVQLAPPTEGAVANHAVSPTNGAQTQGPPLDLSVLVIEDMPLMITLMEQLVTYLGCRVAGVGHDGIEGLELLRTTRADVVLMDLMMPRMDGLEVLRRAAAERLPLPFVVVVSGLDDPETVAAARAAGARAFLPKPFSYSQLQGVLRGVRANLPAGAEGN